MRYRLERTTRGDIGMTDKELAEEYANKNVPIDTFGFRSLDDVHYDVKQAFLAGLEYNNKQIAELKEKISVLLSCKNCPENKSGWICVKEYENKCLAQKIEFIKELEKENEQLQEKLNIRSCQNYKHNKSCPNDGSCVHYSKWEDYKNQQLTKAKEIIKDYMTIAKGAHITACSVSEENRTIYVLKLNEEAERLISEVEK